MLAFRFDACPKNSGHSFHQFLKSFWSQSLPSLLKTLRQVRFAGWMQFPHFSVQLIPQQFDGICIRRLWWSFHEFNSACSFFWSWIVRTKFWSMFRVVILLKYKPLPYQIDARWNSASLKYPVIVFFPHFSVDFYQGADTSVAGTTPTITLPPPNLTVGFTHWGACRSSDFLRQYIHRLLPKMSNLDSSVHNTCFHCSIDQFLCSFGHLTRLRTFTDRNNSFLAATRPYKPTSCNRRVTVVSEIGFGSVWLISALISGTILSLNRLLNTCISLSSLFVVFLGQPERFLSEKDLVSANLSNVVRTPFCKTPSICAIFRCEWPVSLKITIRARFSFAICFALAIFKTIDTILKEQYSWKYCAMSNCLSSVKVKKFEVIVQTIDGRWGSKSLVRILKYRCIEQKLIRGKKMLK